MDNQAERSAELQKLRDLPVDARTPREGRDVREFPGVTLPLDPDPGFPTAIYPEFQVDREHRVRAELPEDGKYQEWTGKVGQEADAWVLRGYSWVTISIECDMGGGKWTPCALTVRHPPLPFPNPLRTVWARDPDQDRFQDCKVVVAGFRPHP